MTQIGRHD